MFLFSIIGLIRPVVAAVPLNANNDSLSQMNAVLASLQTKNAVAEVASPDAVIPRGPADVLKDYENQMVGVSQWLTGQLGEIAKAVESGELTREQGEYFSGERYQAAIMQFQFLRTEHAILEHDIEANSAPSATTVAPKNSAPAEDSAPTENGQAVVLALPFSSLQLDLSLAQSLGLNPQQVSAIQELMSKERVKIEPIMAQFRTTQHELLATTQNGRPNDKRVQSLTEAQARLLTKLIAANWRLQSDLAELLSPEQRKKLDEVKRSRGLAVQ
jgi:Spy/CpxP family protein refolding chaperone